MSTLAPVRDVTNSQGFERLARLGLATRAVIYLLIGWLAVLIAEGEPGKAADQRGALQEVVRHTGGTVLLWVIVAGFIGYSLWRFSEAAFGVTGEGRKVGPACSRWPAAAFTPSSRSARCTCWLPRPT
jgi:Domain of Unknown Function (DUF1206)